MCWSCWRTPLHAGPAPPVTVTKAMLIPGLKPGPPLRRLAQRWIFGPAVCGAGRAMGFVCAPHLFQDVVLKCMGKLSDMNIYDENRKLLYNGLKEMGYECVYPSGAFYLFVKSPEPDANAFSEKAKKLNLLIVPADSFGCPGYVRISYCVDPDMIRRSFAAFKALIESYA